jgi:hypothetical protein
LAKINRHQAFLFLACSISSSKLVTFGLGVVVINRLNWSSGNLFFKYRTTSKYSHQQSRILKHGC